MCRLEGVKFEHAVVGLVLASRLRYSPKVTPCSVASTSILSLKAIAKSCRSTSITSVALPMIKHARECLENTARMRHATTQREPRSPMARVARTDTRHGA